MNWGAHLAANLLVALLVAAARERRLPAWASVWPILRPMAASNLMDLDHLLADPVHDPDRCSLGFHPLHTAPAALAYGAGLLWVRFRWLAVGALTHLVLDGVDCVL